MTHGVMTMGTGDADALARLHAQCFDPPWQAVDFYRLMSLPGSFCLGASEHDDLIGFILFSAIPPGAEILTVCVHPRARRRGIAQGLLAQSVALLATRCITRIFLEVADGNEAARRLYARAGFTESRRRKAYYRNGEDAIVMARPVTATPDTRPDSD